MTKQIDINRETIKKTIAEFERHEGTKENVLKKVFSNRSNDNVEDVLIKVTLLNAFYSTQLYNNPATNSYRRHHADILSMAKHIVDNRDFDKLLYSDNLNDDNLNDDNLKAVEYIAVVGSKWINRSDISDSLSFSTKYCNWHYPDKYPIVDAIAKGMIYNIFKDKNSSLYDKELKQKDLSDYHTFCEKFNRFRTLVSERDNRQYSVKEIDEYLWQYGKDHEIAI